VESLPRKGAKVEDQDWFGNNALLSAASGGHTSIIELMIDKWGANIDTRRTAVNKASSSKIGVDKTGYTPLIIAVYYGHKFAVELLQNRGVDRKAVGEGGSTLLHIAASQLRADMVDYLINNGAQIGETDKSGNTALHCTCREGILSHRIELDQSPDGFPKSSRLRMTNCRLRFTLPSWHRRWNSSIFY
jgi:ankyrin repeat protein